VSQAAASVRPAKAAEAEWLKFDFGESRVARPLPPPPAPDVKEAILRWLNQKL
jgi:hypothetical protein